MMLVMNEFDVLVEMIEGREWLMKIRVDVVMCEVLFETWWCGLGDDVVYGL